MNGSPDNQATKQSNFKIDPGTKNRAKISTYESAFFSLNMYL